MSRSQLKLRSPYQQMIDIIREENNLSVPAPVIEASMRLEYGTLDALPRAIFVKEAILAETMYRDDRQGMLDLAKSYGLGLP